MPVHTTMATGKIGELHVLGELLRRGVNPYVPLVDQEGIDAVIRRRDGTYLELQIKTIATPKYPRWFGARISRPRNQLFMVCVTLVTEPIETWIIPSHVFKTHSTFSPKSGVCDLDLEGTKRGSEIVRKKLLAEYCNAWHLLTEEAETTTEESAISSIAK